MSNEFIDKNIVSSLLEARGENSGNFSDNEKRNVIREILEEKEKELFFASVEDVMEMTDQHHTDGFKVILKLRRESLRIARQACRKRGHIFSRSN